MILNKLIAQFTEMWHIDRKQVANIVYSSFLGSIFYGSGMASGSYYPELVEFAGVRKGDIVLDVACGTCPLLGIDREYGVVGLDIAEGLLKTAVKRGGTLLDVKDTLRRDDLSEMFGENQYGVYLVHGDAEDLPFEDGLFDAVIYCNFVPGFVNLEKAVEEMARVVKPGRNVAAMSIHNPGVPETAASLEELSFYDVTTGTAGPSRTDEEPTKSYREALREMMEVTREDGKESGRAVLRKWQEGMKRKKAKPLPFVYGTKPD